MPFAQERARCIPIRSEHADASLPKKRIALPQYRYMIRTTAILVAVVGDILIIVAAALTAAFIRFLSLSDATPNDLLFVIVPAFLLAGVALDCYQLTTLRNSFRSVGRTLLALAIAAGIGFTAAFALQVGATYSRLQTGGMLMLAAAYLTVARVLYKQMLDHLSDAIDPQVLILGPDFRATDIAANIDRKIPSEAPNPANPNSLERTYEQVRHADRIILAFDDVAERAAWAQFVRLIGIDAELIEPNLQNISVLGVNHWEGAPTLVVARGALTYGERAFKRAVDLAISIPLLAVTGPLLLLLMVLIKLDSPGPAIFAQSRVGRNNRRYQCYKLRTMYHNMADPHGGRSTARNDDRVTKIGKVLRRYSLDEFPQLWNVIRGDMSLVGPRPHPLGAVAEGALFWDAVPDYWTRHALRPGMTGLAQVRGLRGATITRSDIEKRVAADLEYINNWSIWLDLKILLQTTRVIFNNNAF